MQDNEEQLEKWSESVNGELYEELLNRYERVLVYAGHLQERMRNTKSLSERQQLLLEKNTSLESENTRLEQLLAVERNYVKVLEDALRAVGMLSGSEDSEGEAPSEEPAES